MRVLVVLLVACSSGPRPTGPSALLRRHHAQGDALRVCERGDGLLFTSATKPITNTVRIVQTEHVVAASDHRFELRRDTTSASSRMNEMGGAVGADAYDTLVGKPYAKDDRNRTLDIKPPPPPPDPSLVKASISASPFVGDLLDFTYPEHALRKNETFAVRVRRQVRKDNVIPSELAIDATFTVTKVEPTHIELTCKGTQIETATAANGQTARAELALTCRGRIDRRDGRTARWWIDAEGSWSLTSLDEPGDQFPARTRMHYEVAVGEIDPALCERAKEP